MKRISQLPLGVARLAKAASIGLLALGLFCDPGGTAVASPRPNPQTSSPNPDRGMVVFQAYCVACHGQNGNGDGPVAGKLHADFGIRPTDLASASFQDTHSDKQIAVSIRGGGKAAHMSTYMPAWGTTLSDQQVSDLVAFVRELKPGANDSTAALISIGDQLELGRILYTVRCLVCHGAEGRGDGAFLEGLGLDGGPKVEPLPDFSKPEFFYKRTDESLQDVFYSGISHSRLLPETEAGWWDRPLDSEEMAALILYLRALPMLEGRDQSAFPPHSQQSMNATQGACDD